MRKFADLLKQYRVSSVTGDRYAGQTFEQDFLEHGVSYRLSELTKSQIYEALEPRINAGEVELLDVSRLTEQLLGLVARGTKIDHLPGDHDDLANAAAGAVSLSVQITPITADSFARGVISFWGAMKAVLKADPQLELAYSQPAERVAPTSAAPLPSSVRAAQGREPGETVHRRVTALMQLDPGLTYQMAVHQVLADDPALKAAYARR